MAVNWQEIFLPQTPVIEIVVRGLVTYLALFFLLRLVLKRQSGSVSISDLLVVVLIAGAAQNAMAGSYQSIADGLMLVATILTASYLVDWAGYHFGWMEKLTYPAPLPLIREGKMLAENMRKELVTHGELMSQLREQGIKDLSDVQEAFIEGDGSISIIQKEKQNQGNNPTKLSERRSR